MPSIEQQPDISIDDSKSEKSDSSRFLNTISERFIFITILTFIAVAPLLFLKSVPSHADWHSHVVNSYNFKRCLLEGQWYPRWIDNEIQGYGLPKFNYYSPLLYYLFMVIDFIARNPVISFKLLHIIPFVLCSIFGYIYLRRHVSAVAAAIAVSFIVFSPPLHIFVYTCNFLTSALALPFVFIGLYGIDIFDKEKNFDFKSFLITALGYAGMVLSHLATGFMFTLLCIPYFLLNLAVYKTRKFVKCFILSILLGIGLSAFFLIPASLENNLIYSEGFSLGGWDYRRNFLFTYLDRLPNEGFYWGIFDHRYFEVSNALYGLAAFIGAVLLLSNVDSVKKHYQEYKRIYNSILMFLISFLMMTPISMFAWVGIKQMKTLQFPWRFTTFVLAFGVLVLAYTFDYIVKVSKEKISMSGFRLISFSITILFALLVYVNFINVFRWPWVATEQNVLRAAMAVLWDNTVFRPNLTHSLNWQRINTDTDFSPTIQSSNPLTDVTVMKWFSHERIFQVFSTVEHSIRLRTYYFPGWNAYIDQNPVNISMDPNDGAIVINIPPGKHEIKFRFESTPLRKTSTNISIVSFLIFIYFMFNNLIKKKKIQKIELSDDVPSAEKEMAIT